MRALTEAALACGYEPETVVELCRLYYGQPRLEQLTDEQVADMVARLREAHARGLSDERLRRMATRGLAMDDRPHARQAADLWLGQQART